MAATYNDALPTAKDRIRAALGDINMAKALLSDEHINAVLVAETNSVPSAIVRLARELIVRFAQKPTKIKAGDVEVDYKDRIQELRNLIATMLAVLAAEAAAAGGANGAPETPTLGRVSVRPDPRFWT